MTTQGNTEGSPVNQESNQNITTNIPSDMEVDIDGITVKVPYEQGKRMIEKRQEKHKLFKEISEKATSYEKELNETRKKLEFESAAKKGAYEEARQLALRETSEKLQKLQNAIISKELKATLVAHNDFIGGDATSDALQLLGATGFALNDQDEVVSKDGKPVKDVVSDFINSKPLFKKAKTAPGLNANLVQNGQKITPQKDNQAKFRKGLEKLIG
jgi:hypothetical protein